MIAHLTPTHTTTTGFIGPVYGWRLPFVVIAIPSILVIALVMLTMQEPPRAATHHPHHHQNHNVHHHGVSPGAAGAGVILAEEALTEVDDEDADDDDEEEEEQGPSLARNGCSIQLRKFMDVFVIRTNLLAFCQSLPGCLPWGCVRPCCLLMQCKFCILFHPPDAHHTTLSQPHPPHSVISAFLTDFLHEQRGMTVAGATALMFVFGLGCFAGNLAGGILGQVRLFHFCTG